MRLFGASLLLGALREVSCSSVSMLWASSSASKRSEAPQRASFFGSKSEIGRPNPTMDAALQAVEELVPQYAAKLKAAV